MKRQFVRRGFTFIEMMIVIFVLSLTAAIVMPRMVTMRESARERAFEDHLSALVARARREAQSRNQTVRLQVKESRFEASVRVAGTDDEVLASETMPDGVSARTLTSRGTEAPTGDWYLTLYPDGRTHRAEIELSESGRSRTMRVYADGRVTWREGATGEEGEESWEAGELEQRTG